MILFFILLILFCFSPLIALITSVLIALKYHKNYNYGLLSCFFMSLFLGSINSLKIPESDLINYFNFFKSASDFSLIQYILFSGKAYFFNLINYVLYYITSGSFSAYIIILTIISYFVLFLSIFKIHFSLGYGKTSLLLSVGVAALFPTLFSLSAHLLRQFLASSLIVYFLICHFFYDKKKWWLIISAGLIHISAFFFMIFMIPFFKRALTIKNTIRILMISCIIILFTFYLSEKLLDVLSSIPLISYAIDRITITDKYVSFNKLGLLNFLFLGFNVLATYLGSLSKNYSKKNRVRSLFLVNLFLLLFIILNFNNTEIALRFSFYGYFMFPFSFYFLSGFLIKNHYNKTSLLVTLFILFGFMLLFIDNIFNGSWTYQNVEKILFLWLN